MAEDEKPKRTVGRPWPKGQSGNIKGRPPVDPEFMDMLDAGEPLAWDILRQAMTAKKVSWADRIKAAQTWIAYRRGKPKEQVELTGPGGGPLEAQAQVLQLILTDEATRDLLDAAAARAALLAGEPGSLRGAPEPGALAPGQAPPAALPVAGAVGDDQGPAAPPPGGVDAAPPREK